MIDETMNLRSAAFVRELLEDEAVEAVSLVVSGNGGSLSLAEGDTKLLFLDMHRVANHLMMQSMESTKDLTK
jgi:hypothetical protein